MLFEQYGGQGEEGWVRLGRAQRAPLALAAVPASLLFAVSIGKNMEKGGKREKSLGWGEPGHPVCCRLASKEVVFPLRAVSCLDFIAFPAEFQLQGCCFQWEG